MQPIKNMIRYCPVLLLTLFTEPSQAATAYLSFTGGNGTPLGITLHTPLYFEVTSPIPGGNFDLNEVFGIAFRNVGDLLSSRSVSGNIAMTVNGSAAPYNAVASFFESVEQPLRWGIANTDNNDLIMSNEFIYYTQLYGPAALDSFSPGLGAILSDFPLGLGTTFEWSAGTMTTNSAITLLNTPVDGFYEVDVVNLSGAKMHDILVTAAVPEPSVSIMALSFAGLLLSRRCRKEL